MSDSDAEITGIDVLDDFARIDLELLPFEHKCLIALGVVDAEDTQQFGQVVEHFGLFLLKLILWPIFAL